MIMHMKVPPTPGVPDLVPALKPGKSAGLTAAGPSRGKL